MMNFVSANPVVYEKSGQHSCVMQLGNNECYLSCRECVTLAMALFSQAIRQTDRHCVKAMVDELNNNSQAAFNIADSCL